MLNGAPPLQSNQQTMAGNKKLSALRTSVSIKNKNPPNNMEGLVILRGYSG